MRSGNGRHRRPRQAPALFVAAGVTGAGLAMPLLAASGAQAADGASWDRVAECESGGLWSANAGNGYYGGLQLTLETWKEYGGTALAARPDLASRGQQIEIAEKILADRGPEAWPSCSVGADLLPEASELPEAPDVEVPDVEVPDVEVPDVPDAEPSDPTEPPGTPDGGTRAPTDGVTEAPTDGVTEDPADGATGDPADGSSGEPSGGPSRVPTDDPPTGPDGGPADDPSASPAPEDSNGTGSGIGDSPEASAPGTGDGAGRHRGAPGEGRQGGESPSSRGTDGPSRDAREEGGYRVRPGDSLSAIAAEQDVPGGWTTLYEANRNTVGDDPDLILPGQLLDLRTGGELR